MKVEVKYTTSGREHETLFKEIVLPDNAKFLGAGIKKQDTSHVRVRFGAAGTRTQTLRNVDNLKVGDYIVFYGYSHGAFRPFVQEIEAYADGPKEGQFPIGKALPEGLGR